MKITKLSVSSFGKLRDEGYKLDDGINVVYGMNESGKSTMLSFIRFVLFGCSGRKSSGNVTFEEKYTPWDNTAMAGSVEFEEDGLKYLSSRSHGMRKEHSVVNTITGETCFEGTTPGEAIYNMNESAFTRSYYLSANSCAITTDKNDDILKGLTNLAHTGDEALSYSAACTKINSEKKSMVEKLNNIDNDILDLRKKLERISSLKERSKVLEEKLDHAENIIEQTNNSIDDKIEMSKRYQRCLEKYASARLYQQAKGIVFVLLLLVSIIMLVSKWYIPALISVAFIVFTVIFMFLGRRKISLLITQLRNFEQNINKNSGKTKREIQAKDDQKSVLLKEIGAIESELEREYSYDDICSQIECLNGQREECKKRIAVIDKAINILNTAYSELKNLFSPVLNKRASEIFSSITGENYNDIIISDGFDIKTKSEYDYKPSQSFSASTYEMMYFSLRLALCDILSGGKKLPVFLDDCFVLCDDIRAATAVKFLSEYAKNGRQIIFCTCHKREKELFESIGNINIIDLTEK